MATRKITIWRLTAHTCRWPEGEPDEPAVFFCGRKPVPGYPYCLEHCCKAFLGFGRRDTRERVAA